MLEQVVELLGTKRKPGPLEARWEWTEAYARFVIAAGFARIGDAARAHELQAQAMAAFTETALRDPVHSYLVEAFTDRVTQASTFAPRAQPPSEMEFHFLQRLTRVARYKVDRLRERCRTLTLDDNVDAMRDWTRGVISSRDDLGTRHRGALATTLRALRTPEHREELAAFLDDTVARPELSEGQRLLVAGALAALADARATPILEQTFAKLAQRITRTDQQQLLRELAAAATYAGERGNRLLDLVLGFYSGTSDAYGTNTHFCLTVIEFIDLVVVAATDLYLAALPPDDPRLASGFAF